MLAVEAASSKMEALRIREYAVDPALAPFVKSVWSLESDGRVCEPARERILPDGCVELVFHFNDPFRSYFANGDRAVQPRSFVVGQMKGSSRSNRRAARASSPSASSPEGPTCSSIAP
jgi:Domain of unknown function (DUF6597)